MSELEGSFETVKLVQMRWENETRQASHVKKTKEENTTVYFLKPIFRWGERKLFARSTGKAEVANIPIPLGDLWEAQEEASPLFPLQ